MTNHLDHNADVEKKANNDSWETVALIVVSLLLILTSVGNAMLLFCASLAAMLALFVWFLTDRKFWLATISGMAFAITVLGMASKLF